MAKERRKKSEKYREIAAKMAEGAGVVEVNETRRTLTGFALTGDRSITVPSPTTLRRLYIFAHECGHVAHGHAGGKSKHRQEFEAETWARRSFRRHGLEIPAASDRFGRRYVAYKIRQAIRRGAKRIDPEAREYARDHLDPYYLMWAHSD